MTERNVIGVPPEEAFAGGQTPSWLRQVAGGQAVERQAEERTEDIPFSELVSRSFGIDTVFTSVLREQELAGLPPQDNWVPPEDLEERMEQYGIPLEYAGDILDDVASDDQLEVKLRQTKFVLDESNLLSQAGGRGIAARFVGAMADPVTVPADIITGGLAGTVVKGGRIARIGAGAFAGGAINAGATAILADENPLLSTKDVMIDLVAGMTLGGLGGAISPSRSRPNHMADDLAARMERYAEDSVGAARADIDPEVVIKSKSFEKFQAEAAFADPMDAHVNRGILQYVPTMMLPISSRIERMAAQGKISPEVLALKREMMPDAVGYKKGTNQRGITEDADRVTRDFDSQFHREAEPFLRKFLQERDGNLKGTAKSTFGYNSRTEFWDQVGRAMRGEKVDDPNVRAAAERGSKVFDRWVDELVSSGVKGAEFLKPQGRYLPRVWNQSHIQLLRERVGSAGDMKAVVKELVYKGVEAAIARKRLAAPGVQTREFDEAITEKVAEAYANTYLTMGRATDKNRVQINSTNEGYLEDVLESAGFDADDIDAIVEEFKYLDGPPDRQNAKALKQRLDMDLDVEAELHTGDVIRLGDLFDTNAERIVSDYNRTMGGHVALARKGFKTEKDLDDFLDRMELDPRKEGNAEAVKILRAAKDHALGRSLENDPTGSYARIARTVRDHNFLRILGSVGFAQLAEFGTALGASGLRPLMAQMPAMRKMLSQAKSGEMLDDLAYEMAVLGNPGTTMLRNTVSLRPEELNLSGMNGNSFLRGFDKWMQGAKKAQAIFSGLGPITDFQQIMNSRAFAQKLRMFADGRQKLTKSQRARLKDYGLEDADIEKLMDHMLNKAEVDSHGVLTSVKLDDLAEDIDLFDKVQTMMNREIRHIIQEGDFGASFLWQHTTTGKIAGQFRNFMVTAYSRHFLHSVARPDAQTGGMVMGGMAFASMGYMGRIAITYANDPEKREKLLTWDRVVKGSIAGTAHLGMIPFMVDSMAFTLRQPAVFGYSSRSSGLGQSIAGIPTVDTINKLGAAFGIPGDILRTDREVSEEQMRSALELVWFANFIGAKNFINSTASMFPSSSEADSWED